MLANRLIVSNRSTVLSSTRLIGYSIGVVCVAFVFSARPVFAQADYSDVYFYGNGYSGDDATYDEELQQDVSVIGVGVTDSDYSGDAIGVETTLTSPNGRTVSGESDDYGSARVEIVLPWDPNEVGNWLVHTRHQPLCLGNWDGSMIYETRGGGGMQLWWNPNYYRCAEARQTSHEISVGVSISCYSRTSVVYSGNSVIASYRVIEYCPCTCKSTTATVRFRGGLSFTPKPYLVVAEPYAVFLPYYVKVCAHVTTWRDVTNCSECIDLE